MNDTAPDTEPAPLSMGLEGCKVEAVGTVINPPDTLEESDEQ